RTGCPGAFRPLVLWHGATLTKTFLVRCANEEDASLFNAYACLFFEEGTCVIEKLSKFSCRPRTIAKYRFIDSSRASFVPFTKSRAQCEKLSFLLLRLPLPSVSNDTPCFFCLTRKVSGCMFSLCFATSLGDEDRKTMKYAVVILIPLPLQSKEVNGMVITTSGHSAFLTKPIRCDVGDRIDAFASLALMTRGSSPFQWDRIGSLLENAISVLVGNASGAWILVVVLGLVALRKVAQTTIFYACLDFFSQVNAIVGVMTMVVVELVIPCAVSAMGRCGRAMRSLKKLLGHSPLMNAPVIIPSERVRLSYQNLVASLKEPISVLLPPYPSLLAYRVAWYLPTSPERILWSNLQDTSQPPLPPITSLEAPQMVSSVKLPILKKGEYILWTIKMEQYLAHTDYALWEVILNGNSTVQMTKDDAGVSTEDANQNFLRSLPSAWSNISLIMRNKPVIDNLDIDDLYNNLKVYEADIKGSSGSSSNSQNVAFVSAESTSSTNEFNAAYNVSIDIGHSSQAQEEEAIDFALMAFTSNPSSSSSSNSEFNEKEVLDIQEEELTKIVFDNRSSDEEDSLANDRFKKGEGYHAVSPPLTENDMPSKPDLSFAGLEDSIYKFKISKIVTSLTKDALKTSTACVEKPKEDRSSAPLIEDYDTDSDDDSSFKHEPIPAKIDFVKAVDSKDWNGKMTQKLGLGFGFTKKACFVCGSLSHLIKECTFHEDRMAKKSVLPNNGEKRTGHRESRTVWNNVQRINHQNKFSPTAVFTRSGRIPVSAAKPKAAASTSAAKPVKTAGPKQSVNFSKSRSTFHKSHSPIKRSFYNPTTHSRRHSTERVNTAGSNAVNAVKGNRVTVFKTSAGNKAHLADYQEINDGGFVAFGSSRGKITGKGKITIKKLDFDDVYLNVVPSRDLICLFAKASIDESNLWHKRLGHVSFKTMNKLVKGNLVKGLPSKIFDNNHSCVACQKGKQHKATCKAKLMSLISQPLEMLHMDLFGLTSVMSINHKKYCLVVTDDFSRFSWVFFLATKDEISKVLKPFITAIENQINKKLIQTEENAEFHQIVDFLSTCSITYALTTRFETASTRSSDPPLSTGQIVGSGEDRMEQETNLMDFVPPIPHDSPLLGGHTSGSDEGRRNLLELMNICTQLSNRVLALEEAKTNQDKVITRLKLKVKRLEKKRKVRTSQPMMRILFKGRIETFTNKILGENASKQGRNDYKIEEFNLTDEADTKVIVEDKGSGEKGGSTANQVSTARPEVNKGKGVLIEEELEKLKKVKRRDQGLAQIESDAVLVQRIYEEELAELDRAQKKKQKQEEATIVALTEEFDEIQARMDADHELAVRLTHEEQEKYTIEERARLLAEYFKRRKKQLAVERAEALRNKPPTRN
nr:ribonuclease H-like domain-containing protein [Tanacetum cinerariifolium]